MAGESRGPAIPPEDRTDEAAAKRANIATKAQTGRRRLQEEGEHPRP